LRKCLLTMFPDGAPPAAPVGSAAVGVSAEEAKQGGISVPSAEVLDQYDRSSLSR
jgi:hypothetical protein